MKRNSELNGLLDSFAELCWLKPVDIVWYAVNAYLIQKHIDNTEKILDLGCGDGLYTALMLGGRMRLDYDRFLNVKPENQKIEDNQFGDIYTNPIKSQGLLKQPKRKVNGGLELKQYHIDIARSLGIYDELIQGRFEQLPYGDESFDKIFSIFAFYWGDDLESQFKEVYRVLRKNGEFFVNMPSEFLGDLHLAKKLSENEGSSSALRDFFKELDGGRWQLTSRYGRSVQDWKEYMKKFGLEFIEAIPVVNEVMFTLQDISQRPFLPAFFNMSKEEDFAPYRDSVKKYLCQKVYPSFIDPLLEKECDTQVRHGYYLLRVVKK